METKEKALAEISDVLNDCKDALERDAILFKHLNKLADTTQYYNNDLIPRIEKAKELIQNLKTTK